MFDKLRLKLTLINVAVTVTLFVILISGVYTLLHYNAERGSDYILKKLAANVQSKKITDIPARTALKEQEAPPAFLPPPPRPNFFFAKTDANGNVIRYSSNITITPEELAQLAEATLLKEADRSTVRLGKISFNYLKENRLDGPGTLLVYNDLSDETAFINALLTNLILVGLFCCLLSFFASFFMAKHAIKPIQYALLQQKSFVSNASHELRTPVTIMQANLDVLCSAPPDDSIENNRKWLRNMQDETTRMAELINSLLFLARADANQEVLEKEYFPIEAALSDAVASFEMIAKRKNIALTAEASGACTAFGDPARIRQALTILIDNALRHTPEAGEVTVACREGEDALCLSVKDTGEGIAAEHLSKIFDRFYQADESRNKGGAGLGLSIAKWIVEHHDGTIEITSQPGKGTAVTIKLPRRVTS